jgi:hypothetical protein
MRKGKYMRFACVPFVLIKLGTCSCNTSFSIRCGFDAIAAPPLLFTHAHTHSLAHTHALIHTHTRSLLRPILVVRPAVAADDEGGNKKKKKKQRTKPANFVINMSVEPHFFLPLSQSDTCAPLDLVGRLHSSGRSGADSYGGVAGAGLWWWWWWWSRRIAGYVACGCGGSHDLVVTPVGVRLLCS